MAGELKNAWNAWLDAANDDTDTNKALADALVAFLAPDVSGPVDEPRAPAPGPGVDHVSHPHREAGPS